MKFFMTALMASLAILPSAFAAPTEAGEPALEVAAEPVLEPRCIKIGNHCKYGDHGCCGDLTCKSDIHVTGASGTCGHR